MVEFPKAIPNTVLVSVGVAVILAPDKREKISTVFVDESEKNTKENFSVI